MLPLRENMIEAGLGSIMLAIAGGILLAVLILCFLKGLRRSPSTPGCGLNCHGGGNIQMRNLGFVVQCAVFSVAAVLSACAGGMIPGQIYSEQGKVLEFQIEKARRTGAVTAFDPQTGEHYSGN